MDLPEPANSLPLRGYFPRLEMGRGVAAAVGMMALLLLLNVGDRVSLPAGLLGLAALGQGLILTVTGLVWAHRKRLSRQRLDMGLANQITLLRALMVMIIAAFIAYPDAAIAHVWSLAGLSLVALCLDGVDGWVARRTDSQTAFGARFDMEIDALFMLVLAALLVSMQVTGAWVLLIGLMRYGFVVAGWVWRWLQAPLPDSFRRKLVCVWQLATLMAGLVPWLPDGLVSAGLLLALILLVYSFAVDVRWLYQQPSAR